jgi:hypothetical protein
VDVTVSVPLAVASVVVQVAPDATVAVLPLTEAVNVQLLVLFVVTSSLEFDALCARVRLAVMGLVVDCPLHVTVWVTAVGVQVPSNAPRSGPELLLLEQPARAIARAAPTKATELRMIDSLLVEFAA